MGLAGHTNQCQKNPCHKEILCSSQWGLRKYMSSYVLTLSWFIRGPYLLQDWRICTTLHTRPPGQPANRSTIPLETKYNLRIFLNPVPQRATTNPLNELSIENYLPLRGLYI